MRPRTQPPQIIERVTTWIGSRASLLLHSIVFLGFFATVWFGVMTLETMLLILTTAVSLEAIYLAIFIQMTVNQNTESLREVEENIDEIQEDVEEIGEDIDEIQEDVEEMSEDIEELQEEEGNIEVARTDRELLEKLTQDLAQVVRDLEALKKAK